MMETLFQLPSLLLITAVDQVFAVTFSGNSDKIVTKGETAWLTWNISTPSKDGLNNKCCGYKQTKYNETDIITYRMDTSNKTRLEVKLTITMGAQDILKTNQSEKTANTYFLDVKGVPSECGSRMPASQNVRVGQTVNFIVELCGKPKPNITCGRQFTSINDDENQQRFEYLVQLGPLTSEKEGINEKCNATGYRRLLQLGMTLNVKPADNETSTTASTTTSTIASTTASAIASTTASTTIPKAVIGGIVGGLLIATVFIIILIIKLVVVPRRKKNMYPMKIENTDGVTYSLCVMMMRNSRFNRDASYNGPYTNELNPRHYPYASEHNPQDHGVGRTMLGHARLDS